MLGVSFILAAAVGCCIVYTIGLILSAQFDRSLNGGLIWTLVATIGTSVACTFFVAALVDRGYYYPKAPQILALQFAMPIALLLISPWFWSRILHDPMKLTFVRLSSGWCLSPIAAHLVGCRVALEYPPPSNPILQAPLDSQVLLGWPAFESDMWLPVVSTVALIIFSLTVFGRSTIPRRYWGGLRNEGK